MPHPLITLILTLLLSVTTSAHAFGALRVRCNVEGATVLLDGRSIGTCPAKDAPKAGRHRLVVEKPINDQSVYRYQTEINVSDGEVLTIEATLSQTLTEDGLYQRGNDDAYLQQYPNGKYARAIQDKRRQAEAEALRVQREAAETQRRQEREAQENQRRQERETAAALRSATLKHKEAQRQVDKERKLQAANWRAQYDAQVAEFSEVFSDCPDCPDMVIIPPGNFVMGSIDPEGGMDEWPPHAVTIARPFAMGKFTVTVGQYTACVTAGGCRPPLWLEKGNEYNIHTGTNSWYKNMGETISGTNAPITGVSWNDARAYVAWISGKTGKRYTLPSEAQWEYAARAGTTTPFYTGDCINTGQANFNGNYDYNNCGAKSGVYREKPTPVGSFPPNAFGLHDMAGNVWQWLDDCYHENYQDATADGSAWTTACSNDARVLRGGSWFYSPANLRSAIRYWITPGNRYVNYGFRLVRTLVTP